MKPTPAPNPTPGAPLEKAFTIKACNGAQGCRNAILKESELAGEIAGVFAARRFDEFLKTHLSGPLRSHHQLKVAISYCPNACSQPQIADLGIILAAPVRVTDNPCSFCRACVKACIEEAIVLDPATGPAIIPANCLHCGKCGQVCPTQTIERGEPAFRFLVGGKLGRHPRLATELPGLHAKSRILSMVGRCLDLFMAHHPKAGRMADLFSLIDPDRLLEEIVCCD